MGVDKGCLAGVWEGEKEAETERGYGGFPERVRKTSGGMGDKMPFTSPCGSPLVYLCC